MTRDEQNKLKRIISDCLEWDKNQGDPGLFDNFLKQYNFEKCWHVQKSTEEFFDHYWIDSEGNKVRSGKNNFILSFVMPGGFINCGNLPVERMLLSRKHGVIILEEGFKMPRDFALRVLILGYIP